MRGVRYFEIFIILLVLGVVICFCIELSLISVPSVREIFRGYAPSRVLIESQGYAILTLLNRSPPTDV